MQPNVNLVVTDRSAQVKKDISSLLTMQVYVGIPEAGSIRNKAGITNAQLAFLHTNGVRAPEMLNMGMASMVSGKLTYNLAHSLYIHSHGSPLWQIPPRPIIEPAIEAKGNIEPIRDELKEAATAVLDGDKAEAVRHLKRAGMTGQNAARGWFTDSRNGWAPNAPSTIKAKGSDRPLIDTAQLRKAITYVVDQGKVQ
jgi:hypothetical protein